MRTNRFGKTEVVHKLSEHGEFLRPEVLKMLKRSPVRRVDVGVRHQGLNFTTHQLSCSLPTSPDHQVYLQFFDSVLPISALGIPPLAP